MVLRTPVRETQIAEDSAAHSCHHLRQRQDTVRFRYGQGICEQPFSGAIQLCQGCDEGGLSRRASNVKQRIPKVDQAGQAAVGFGRFRFDRSKPTAAQQIPGDQHEDCNSLCDERIIAQHCFPVLNFL